MKIPAFILSGFLGSGKTTLLLQLLEEARTRELQPGILMNELGLQDVDGHLIGEQNDVQVERLLDGCVCCNKKGELAGCLRQLLQRQPDLILIELTGVANPEEIAAVLAESFRHEIQGGQVITILDAEHMLDYNSIFASDRQLILTLRRQIAVADLILVNKTDLASAHKLGKIEKVVRKQNERAPILYTVHSQMDVASLFEGITTSRNPPRPSKVFHVVHAPTEEHRQEHQHDHADDSYSQIQSITLPFPVLKQFSKPQLEQFLHHWFPQLVRMKGYVRIAGTVELFQFAGGRITWAPSTYPGTPYLVVIGMQLNKIQMLAEWTAFCDSPDQIVCN
jgi:G3E family GTPase